MSGCGEFGRKSRKIKQIDNPNLINPYQTIYQFPYSFTNRLIRVILIMKNTKNKK